MNTDLIEKLVDEDFGLLRQYVQWGQPFLPVAYVTKNGEIVSEKWSTSADEDERVAFFLNAGFFAGEQNATEVIAVFDGWFNEYGPKDTKHLVKSWDTGHPTFHPEFMRRRALTFVGVDFDDVNAGYAVTLTYSAYFRKFMPIQDIRVPGRPLGVIPLAVYVGYCEKVEKAIPHDVLEMFCPKS